MNDQSNVKLVFSKHISRRFINEFSTDEVKVKKKNNTLRGRKKRTFYLTG
jgi:hypothetical protein